MRPKSLVFPLLLSVACGGTSRTTSGDRGDGSRGGRGGSTGSGGTSGVSGTGAGGTTVGKGGFGGKGGGPSGKGGGPSGGTGTGEAGEPGAAGEGSGARGGSGGSGGSSGSGGSAAMPAITSCTDEFPFAGTWEGQILDFYFEPVDDLSLVVTPETELGGYAATVTWGSGDPPPPVRSGDEPYPSAEFWRGVDDIDGLGSIEPWPGFAFSVVRGAGCDRVFRVSVSAAEPWDEWCSLQTPQCRPELGCGCIYKGGGSSNSTMCDAQDGRGNVLGTYPLWKCQMCGRSDSDGVCECSETSCSFNHTVTHTFDLELIQSGGVDVLTGPSPDRACSDCTVRLERVE
jgi:hypothetical protein